MKSKATEQSRLFLYLLFARWYILQRGDWCKRILWSLPATTHFQLKKVYDNIRIILIKIKDINSA